VLWGEDMAPVLGHVLSLEIGWSGAGEGSKEGERNCPRLVKT